MCNESAGNDATRSENKESIEETIHVRTTFKPIVASSVKKLREIKPRRSFSRRIKRIVRDALCRDYSIERNNQSELYAFVKVSIKKKKKRTIKIHRGYL